MRPRVGNVGNGQPESERTQQHTAPHLYGQKPVAGVVQRVNVDAMLATQMVEHPHLALVGRQVPKHLFARLSMPQQAQRESSCMHTAHAAQFVPPNQGQGCDTLLAAE